MTSEDKIYRDLQQHLDRSPSGFPATESGADIRLLKHLLTPEEARIANMLSTMKPETVKKIYKRVHRGGMSITVEDLQKKLDHMVHKGTILTFSKDNGERLYKNVGVSAGGMIDFQVNRLTVDFIDDLDKYHEESFAKMAKPRTTPIPQLRTVPVEKSVTIPEKKLVSTYDDVRHLVEQAPGPFSVANCICRQMKDMRNQKCQYSDMRETCLQIGPDHARQYVEMGIARSITKEEVFRILDKAQEAGFILQPENSLKPQNICCCCGDCCGPLTAAKKSPHPSELYASNYFATIKAELCTSCGTCAKRCQMEARKMENGKVIVDLDRCIGCGNCVTTCKTGASMMVKKEKLLVPFRDKDETFEKIMAGKLGGWGMIKLRLKMRLGMKV
jgi:Na+-translocating ferredoxin:NAD+ oxidoreductase subunit B